MTTLSEARIGMVLHGLLLLAVFLLAAIYHDGPQAAFMYAMTLGPLIRLTSLSLPLPRFDLVYWYALVGLPLILAAFFAMRNNRLSRADVGLVLRRPFLQLLIALCGIGLGAIEYIILRPPPLVEEFNLQQIILPALILLIFTGFLEEFIFRGVMQHTGFENFGWLGGVIYVSVVFAILHIGYASIIDVIFVFSVAVFFAIMTRLTGSIVGVTFAHGLTNIGLFLVFPFLIGSQMLSNPIPRIPHYVNSLGVMARSIKDAPLAWFGDSTQPTLTAAPSPLAAEIAFTRTPLVEALPTNTPRSTTAPLASSIPSLSPLPSASPTRPASQPTVFPTASPIPISTLQFPLAASLAPPTPSTAPLASPASTRPPVLPTATTVAVLPSSPTALATASPPPLTEMVLIPAGIFRMGCDLDKSIERCQADELPLHSVSLDAFSIDRTEVTNTQYAACVSAGACQPPISPASATRPDYFTNPTYASYPVIYVTWFDANAYCLWAGKRLPSEAEWEKASRLSKLAQRFPWGDGAPNCDRANYLAAEGACIGDTNAVGSYPDGANSAGIFDFSGNVSEWVFDWYKNNTYISSIASNPLGPRLGDARVVRGGSWNSPWEDIRLAHRSSLSPSAASPEIGFRCARWP